MLINNKDFIIAHKTQTKHLALKLKFVCFIIYQNTLKETIMLNILYNTKSPRCNSSKCFAYWDGKCSALVSSSFKGGCPFFKDKEAKAAEDLRCKDRVEKWKAAQKK